MKRERVIGREKNYQKSVYHLVFHVDNRRHWGYSKAKKFNTENEVLTQLLDSLQVLWAGPLGAILGSSLQNWRKLLPWLQTGNWEARRQCLNSAPSIRELLLEAAGPARRKMHDPSRPPLSTSLCSAFKTLMSAFDWLNLNYFWSFCSKGNLKNVLLSSLVSAIQKEH